MNWRTRMNARILQTSVGLVGLGAALVIGTITPTEINAQRSPLITAGNRANFGAITLQGGFMPDPHMHAVVSGGSIDVSPFTLAPGCRGFVTAQPDVIFHYNGPASFLRFFVRAAGDTTLVINDGAGHWHCDDDSGGGTNPMVSLSAPPGGQYDIWVGSYRSGEQIRGELGITELSSARP